MSYSEEDLPYTTKDTIACEKCLHLNIVKIKNIEHRKKRDHMLYIDDLSWAKFKKEAAAFDKPLGDFLAFILKFYLAHKEENFSVV